MLRPVYSDPVTPNVLSNGRLTAKLIPVHAIETRKGVPLARPVHRDVMADEEKVVLAG